MRLTGLTPKAYQRRFAGYGALGATPAGGALTIGEPDECRNETECGKNAI